MYNNVSSNHIHHVIKLTIYVQTIFAFFKNPIINLQLCSLDIWFKDTYTRIQRKNLNSIENVWNHVILYNFTYCRE